MDEDRAEQAHLDACRRKVRCLDRLLEARDYELAVPVAAIISDDIVWLAQQNPGFLAALDPQIEDPLK